YAGHLSPADACALSRTDALSIAYQWRRCDTSGGSCSDISGAAAQAYTAVAADVGSTLRVAVTGTNSVGSSSASSAQTAVVAAARSEEPTSEFPSHMGFVRRRLL